MNKKVHKTKPARNPWLFLAIFITVVLLAGTILLIILDNKYIQ